MIDLGKVKPGSTIRIPFGSYTGATGASSATSNFAAGDILIYKDGSTTERASTSGYTASTTFDSLVGINLVTIDLADNTTAGFFAAGSEYIVIIGPVTVDSQTVNFPIARFSIGIRGTILDTTIATLSSQTSFTLTSGPAEDSALNGCMVYMHSIASAVQGGTAVILAYTGSTKTVTLAAGTTFTAAAADNCMVFPPSNVYAIKGVVQTGRDLGASVLLSTGTGTGQLDFTSGIVKSNQAQILGTAVSTPATAGILDVNIKNINNVIAATPGAAGGLFIAGTNAATTVTTSLTTTFTGNLSGSVASVVGAVGSVTGAVGSVTGAVGSVTGNVGGSVASVVGAVGSVTGAVGSVTGAVGSVTGAVGSVGANGITASSIATDAIDADALAADAVTEFWAKALTEPTAVVAASPTALAALSWLLTLSRNKITQTATDQVLKADDGTTTIATSPVSDSGTTFTRGEFA